MRKTHLSLYHYIWFWRRKLGDRKGYQCKVLARGKMNSILVEFRDGFKVITSRFAVRKINGQTKASKRNHYKI